MPVELVDNYWHEEEGLVYAAECVPGPGASLELLNSRFDQRCECKSGCLSDCACTDLCGVAYQDGLLKPSFYQDLLIVECGPLCLCTNCENNIVQRGPSPHLEVVQIGAKGKGLITQRFMPRGQFVCEYAGEIVSLHEAKRRSELTMKNTYILVVKEFFGRPDDPNVTCVDATVVSNFGRYINHSCEPNCAMLPVRVGYAVPKMCVFTLRDVEAGEEVTYSYGSSLYSGLGSKASCYCSSSRCKGLLPRDPFDVRI